MLPSRGRRGMSCGGHRRSLACRRDTLPAPRTLEPRARNFGSSVGALGFGDIRPVRRGGGRCGKTKKRHIHIPLFPHPWHETDRTIYVGAVRPWASSIHRRLPPHTYTNGSQTAPPSVRTHTVCIQYSIRRVYTAPLRSHLELRIEAPHTDISRLTYDGIHSAG